jgi:hypothetical protein
MFCYNRACESDLLLTHAQSAAGPAKSFGPYGAEECPKVRCFETGQTYDRPPNVLTFLLDSVRAVTPSEGGVGI